MKQFISVEEIVANAATIIKDARKEDRNLFRQWAYIAERDIGFSTLNEKVFPTPVEDLCFAKPLDFAMANDLSLYDSQGREYRYSYKGTSKNLHRREDSEFLHDRTIQVYEDSHFFSLSSNGTNITHAKLLYYAYPIDEDGDLLIPETHMVAIMSYIKWMWERRKSENPGMIQLERMEWEIESSRARSKNKMPSMLRGKEIAKNYMSMIDKLHPYKN